MSYSFYEVIPFLYSDMDSDPSLKEDLFPDEEMQDNFSSFMEDLTSDHLYGQITLELGEFTAENDAGETRTFPAKTFNFEVTRSEKVLDDSYEGKTWIHFENDLTDLETGEKFTFMAFYYWTNYDLISISIQKVEAKKPKKSKKDKNTFVVVHKGNTGYYITGIFQSLDKAVEAQGQQDLDAQSKHIEEIPGNCTLNFSNEGKAFITNAVNVFDLNGSTL